MIAMFELKHRDGNTSDHAVLERTVELAACSG